MRGDGEGVRDVVGKGRRRVRWKRKVEAIGLLVKGYGLPGAE